MMALRNKELEETHIRGYYSLIATDYNLNVNWKKYLYMHRLVGNWQRNLNISERLKWVNIKYN